MGTWKTFLKLITYPMAHPQQAMRGGWSIAKKGAIAGTAGYLGWEKLTTDKSLARIAGEAVIGKTAVDSAASVGSDLNDLRESAGNALDKVNNTLSDVGGGMNGIKKFFQGLFSGNGGNMLGDFFSNLGSGKVSGLGIAGLVGAALLIFGRFGWFGKIAGALLGMFVIGNNFNFKNIIGGETTRQTVKESPYASASAYLSNDDPQQMFVKAWDAAGKDYPAVKVPREQYDSLIREGYKNVQIYEMMFQMQREEEKRGTVITR